MLNHDCTYTVYAIEILRAAVMKHLHGKGSRRVRTLASTLPVKITSGTTKVELRAFHQNTERPFADSV